MHSYTRKLLASIILVSPVAGFAADSDQSLSLEEIVVTVQRHEEVLHKSPVSVTAFSANYMEESQISAAIDIASRTPGFSYYEVSPTQRNLAMRGTYTQDGSPGQDQSVVMFVDDVYLGRPGDADVDLFGMERVEVLRGPQGTLFGRNVVGGAINVITKNPTEDFESALEVSFGNYDSLSLKALVSGQLSDNLFGLISVRNYHSDGWSSNRRLGIDAEGRDTTSARAKLRFVPSDELEIILSADITADEYDGMASWVYDSGLGTPELFPDLVYNDFKHSFNSSSGGSDRDATGGTLRINWDNDWFGGSTLTSITAYRVSDFDTRDFDRAPTPNSQARYSLNSEINENTLFTQELRLTRTGESVTWVAGLYYLDATNDRAGLPFGTVQIVTAPGVHAATSWGYVPGVAYTDTAGAFIDTESMAAFGQATWSINDWLSLTVGGRYTRDEKSQDAFGRMSDPTGTHPAADWFVRENFDVSTSESWSEFTPKVTVDASFDDVGIFDSLMAYATYSEGYKGGAYSEGPGNRNVGAALEPEFAENYEIGIKTRLLDNRVGFNVAAYTVDYKNLQTQTFNANNTVDAANAGDASVDGVELELNAIIAEGLSVAVTYGYMDAKFGFFETRGGSRVFTGTEMPQAPEHTFNIDANWTKPIGEGEIFANLNYRFKSDINVTPVQVGAVFPKKVRDMTEFDNLDAFAGYRKGNWTVTLWGRNLEDNQSVISAFNNGHWYLTTAERTAGEAVWLGRVTKPRTFGLTIRYDH